MRPAFIVGWREYRSLTATRSFWITLLVIPLILFFLSLVPSLYGHKPGTNAFVVLDRTGRYMAEIDYRAELEYQRTLMGSLADYAKRWQVHPATPNPYWGDRKGRQLDDIDATAFVAAGGVDAALSQIKPLLPPDATPYEMPPRRFVRAPLPPSIPPDASAAQLAGLIPSLLSQALDTPEGPKPFGFLLYIPEHPELRDQTIHVWTNGRSDGGLATLIDGVVLHDLRVRMMEQNGIDPAIGREIELAYPVMQVTAPDPGLGANRVAVRSAVPLALAYLLLITIIVSGTMMLQGLIEERSNKLLETLLACVDADDLMMGKLIGVGAVGMTIAGSWLICAIAGTYTIPTDVIEALRPALLILHQPLVIVCLAFYFVTGFIMTAIMFLAIGAMSDSMQDAQGYLVPLVFMLTGPFLVLVGTVVDNPNGILPIVLSWIPIYTPFAMLARLGGGVPVLEIMGTAALSLLFIVIEFRLLGRVFRASLLRTGQRPRLREVIRLMRER
jgi:ABC-2 type transport system permease protein